VVVTGIEGWDCFWSKLSKRRGNTSGTHNCEWQEVRMQRTPVFASLAAIRGKVKWNGCKFNLVFLKSDAYSTENVVDVSTSAVSFFFCWLSGLAITLDVLTEMTNFTKLQLLYEFLCICLNNLKFLEGRNSDVFFISKIHISAAWNLPPRTETSIPHPSYSFG